MRDLVLFIFLALVCFQCKTHKPLIAENIKQPASLDSEGQIGFYDALVIGQILYQNDEYYFQIQDILERGRSLPVISKGQKVLLKVTEIKKVIPNESRKGLLRCKNKPNTEECIWYFIPN